MLKIFIFTLFFVAGHATFNVTVNGIACVLLDIFGELNLEAYENNALKANKSLSFAAAEVLNDSSCTEIRLDLGSDAQVWFQFNNSGNNWIVTPIVAFEPKTLGLNDTDSSGTAKPLTPFNKNESFTCKSYIFHNFTLSPSKNYNYTAKAITTNFKVQASGIVNDTFSSGEECDEDRTSTTSSTSTSSASTSSASTSSTSTTVTPGSTTLIPEPSYTCKHPNDTTQFKLQAKISLAITYEKLNSSSNATAYIDVPRDASAAVSCDDAIEQSLKLSWSDDWSLKYVFQRTSNNSKEYYVSNITLTYNTATLVNASKQENVTAYYYDGSKEYLKASTNGYYVCNSNSSVTLSSGVRLFTADLKYKAFNDKGDIDLATGTVSECSADEETSSVVPIAVGAALAGLVVIVLIAYLIGRRRSRKAGYESV